MLCLCPCSVGVVCARVALVCLVCFLLCKDEGAAPVSAITERRDMGLYEVPLPMSFDLCTQVNGYTPVPDTSKYYS